MSKSPHRMRGDAAECWRAILFGETLRAIRGPVIVRADETIKLPRSGRWEQGLGRIAPALDDALGSTAFAIAWRWACAEMGANAWPSLELIARHATDARVDLTPAYRRAPSLEGKGLISVVSAELFAEVSPFPFREGAASGASGVRSPRTWQFHSESISVSDAAVADWSEVDRIASVVTAWLE